MSVRACCLLVGHDDVPTRANDTEAKLFKDAQDVLMPHTRKLGHNSDARLISLNRLEIRAMFEGQQ